MVYLWSGVLCYYSKFFLVLLHYYFGLFRVGLWCGLFRIGGFGVFVCLPALRVFAGVTGVRFWCAGWFWLRGWGFQWICCFAVRLGRIGVDII